jgi:hypothetical protein
LSGEELGTELLAFLEEEAAKTSGLCEEALWDNADLDLGIFAPDVARGGLAAGGNVRLQTAGKSSGF